MPLLLLSVGCGQAETHRPISDLTRMPWDSVVALARGTTVTWRMWRGDPSINGYVDGWLSDTLNRGYGITLHAVAGDGAELVNQLVLEREAGAGSSADLLWINGQTFAQLREEQLLAGPWSARIPNSRYIDSSSSIIMHDFELDPAGFESPWGMVEFALIYDTLRTPEPPHTVAQLGAWIDAHPGRFTHDQGFTGATFLKILMYSLNGGAKEFAGGFDSTRYAVASQRLFAWLDSHRDAFWRAGKVYPTGVAQMHRLFANDEIDFSMSNNQNEAITKARQGVLPMSARPLLLRDGVIANAHYVGIPVDAANPAGAMVVANLLLSPAAQYRKELPNVWGDGTVLSLTRLPPEWRSKFMALDQVPGELPHDSLLKYARPEVAPEWHDHLVADWRARFRGGAH